ncbi:MAG: cache domain-containing protein [Methanosarcinales archaeon]
MISQKKIIIITIALLACTLLIGYISHIYIEKKAEKEFNDQQLVLAKQTAISIDSVLYSIIDDLKILSNLPGVQRMEPSVFRDMVAVYMDLSKKGVIEVALFNANNTLQYSFPQEENTNIVKYPIMALKEAKRTSKPYVSEIINKKEIVIAVPIYEIIKDEINPNPSGKFVGIISAIIDLDIFTSKYLSGIKSGKTGHAILVDKEGNVLYAGENKKIVGKNYYKILEDLNLSKSNETFIPLLQKIMKGESGTSQCYWHCHTGETKTKNLIAYAPLKFGNELWVKEYNGPVDSTWK